MNSKSNEQPQNNHKMNTPIYIKELNSFVSRTPYAIKDNLDERNKLMYPLINATFDSNQSSYLKNVNDYNIIENYNVNPNRVQECKKKNKDGYNCVIDRNVNFSPSGVINFEKWPFFYEKYFFI